MEHVILSRFLVLTFPTRKTIEKKEAKDNNNDSQQRTVRTENDINNIALKVLDVSKDTQDRFCAFGSNPTIFLFILDVFAAVVFCNNQYDCV